MSHQREMLATHPQAIFAQQEDANLDYTINWVGRLDGDTIASSAWVLENGSGITISGETNDTTTATARLTGDTGRYLLTNTITLTTSGETMQAQFELLIKRNDKTLNHDYHDTSHLWGHH